MKAGHTPEAPLVEMRGISKAFPGVQALASVDLQLWAGRVHVLVGENGAGKSTLINVLAGVYEPDAGTILLRGRSARFRDPIAAQRAGIGVVHQEQKLVPALSVAENVFLGRLPHRGWVVDWRDLYQRANAIFDRLGVSLPVRERVRRLSVAQRQFVQIAKALSLNAEILIFDEPTAVLTPGETARLFEVIRGLKTHGSAIVFISHRLLEVFEIGDEVTVLKDGRLVATRPIAEIPDRATLVGLMVGRDLRPPVRAQGGPAGEELLRVEGLSRDRVLVDISFTLHAGEILGIAGLVGSGRTELLRSIFGADPIERGRILVRKRPVLLRSPRKAIKAGLSFLTEDRRGSGLVLERSVRENVSLVELRRFARGGVLLHWEREGRFVRRLVDRFRIKTLSIESLVKTLSGGNQQKVLLARWAGTESLIFLFDEPTRGIDVGAKEDIYQLMEELRAQGAGILMVSSDLPEVLRMSDRILVMNEGRISAEFRREEATEQRVMEHAVRGGDHEVYHG